MKMLTFLIKPLVVVILTIYNIFNILNIGLSSSSSSSSSNIKITSQGRYYEGHDVMKKFIYRAFDNHAFPCLIGTAYTTL